MIVSAEGVLTLFGEPEPAAPQPRGRGTRPGSTDQDTDGGPSTEVFDPSRWIMAGWRCACWRCGPGLTREQNAAVINTPHGPCARCGTRHHRYGPGGQPLCVACRWPGA